MQGQLCDAVGFLLIETNPAPELEGDTTGLLRATAVTLALERYSVIKLCAGPPKEMGAPHVPAMVCACHISSTSRRDSTPTSFFRVMNRLSQGFRV